MRPFQWLSTNLSTTEIRNKVREASNFLMILADQVEDKAVEIMLKFQPVASDLRMVKTFTRISYDLARLGRYAWV